MACSIPSIAIIANSQTPYRLHLHRRITRELREVRLHSLFTHEVSNTPWMLEVPQEINPVSFGPGEHSDDQSRLGNVAHEWAKGGRIVQYLRRHRVSAVVVLGYNDIGRLRLIRWCRQAGVPSLLSGDSNVLGDRATGLRRLAKSLVLPPVLRQCTAVLPCGERGMQYFERYGVPRERMFAFPVEPDYSLLEQMSEQRVREISQRYGLRSGHRRIIFSGRMAPAKRPDLLVDAFSRIADERPDWDLLMVGDGPLREPLSRSLPPGLRDRVTWTGFIGEQGDVSALYRACDALVLPSDYEPWALVLNEAAAAGLAIISSDVVGAAAELVRDGINGRLFPVGDVDALQRGLLDVTDPLRIDAMKAASREVLADWRRRADPVDGLRAALRYCGVITG